LTPNFHGSFRVPRDIFRRKKFGVGWESAKQARKVVSFAFRAPYRLIIRADKQQRRGSSFRATTPAGPRPGGQAGLQAKHSQKGVAYVYTVYPAYL